MALQHEEALLDLVGVRGVALPRLDIHDREREVLRRDHRRVIVLAGAAGCRTFIVHARNAVLKGLSPKENRELPPLKYDYVYRLKAEFPQLEIVINGGIATWADITNHLAYVDGAMLGRVAYHNPWLLADPGKTRAQVVQAMYEYAKRVESVRHVTRHMLGLYHGHRKARLWRRLLSDSERLRPNRPELLLEALETVETPGYAEFTPA
jgi:tRNA-dihydrouridine synthase A